MTAASVSDGEAEDQPRCHRHDCTGCVGTTPASDDCSISVAVSPAFTRVAVSLMHIAQRTRKTSAAALWTPPPVASEQRCLGVPPPANGRRRTRREQAEVAWSRASNRASATLRGMRKGPQLRGPFVGFGREPNYMSMSPMPPMPPPPPPPIAGLVVLRQLGDHRVGRQHQARDRRRVLQREARHLGRIDDAHLHQVAVLARLRR